MSNFKSQDISLHQNLTERETEALTNYINSVLAGDTLLSNILPLPSKSEFLLEAVKDGILLSKLINHCAPGLIDPGMITYEFKDERSKVFKMNENVNVCLCAAKAMGCNLVNIGSIDILNGKGYLVYGVLWQVVKFGLLSTINIGKYPELRKISGDDISQCPPEELLMKWVNYHLKNAGCGLNLKNFTNDVKDSNVYFYLLNQIAPDSCYLDNINEPDELQRAAFVIREAEKIKCNAFLKPQDIVEGNETLNLLFVANLFNKNTGLVPLNQELDQQKSKIEDLECKLMDERKQIAELEQEIEMLKEEGKEKQDQLEKAMENNDLVEASVNMITEKLSSVSAEKGSLESQIELQQQELEKMKSDATLQMQDLNEKLKDCKEAIAKEQQLRLRTKAELNEEIEKVKTKSHQIEVLVAYLRTEKNRSDAHVTRLRFLYNTYTSVETLLKTIFKDIKFASMSKLSDYQGVLVRKGNRATSWKPKRFILKENFLLCYQYDKPDEPISVYRLDDVNVRESTAEEIALRDSQLVNYSFLTFELSKQAPLIVGSNDFEDFDKWKEHFHAASAYWTRQSGIDKWNKLRATTGISFPKSE